MDVLDMLPLNGSVDQLHAHLILVQKLSELFSSDGTSTYVHHWHIMKKKLKKTYIAMELPFGVPQSLINSGDAFTRSFFTFAM